MIDKIHLKNWRSHSESTLEFDRGTNALLGPMGSGKSSVMNAVCFGLFGTFPDIQSRKIKLDDIIMNKPSVKNEAQVTVDFTVGDKTYSVMRVIERDKGTTYSEIREGDKLLDSPNSQRVTELVTKLLKIDYELFSRAIYSEQNGLDYFLRLPRGERMRRIDNLLMIDRFEEARSSTVTLRNRIIERKTAKESVVDLDSTKELKKSLEDIEYSLESLNKTKTKLSEELETKKLRKEKLKKDIREFEDLENKLDSLKEKKNSIKGSMKEIQESIDKYQELLKDKKLDIYKQELRDITKFVKKYEEVLKENRETYEKLTKEISEKETKLDFLKKEIIELKDNIKEKNEIKEKLVKIKKDFGDKPNEILKKERKNLENIQKTITELQTKISQTREPLTKISGIEGKCPTCESDISKKKKENLIEDFEARIKSFNQDLDKNKEKIENRKERVSDLEKVSRDFEIYSEKVKGLAKSKKELEEKLKEHEAYLEIISRKKEKYKKTKNEISEIEEKLEKSKKNKQELESLIEKMKDIHEKKIKNRDLKEDLEKLEEKISKYSKKFEGKNIKKVREEFTNLVSRISELATRVKGLTDVIEEKNQRKEEYKEKIKSMEKQKQEIEKLEKLIKDLKVFEKSLEKTQSQLRENFIDTVNYTMDQIWSNIYPYEDFVSSRLTIREGDYVLQVQREDGEWIDVEGIVSGGERSIASLVLRVAFSNVLAPQLKWLVLDEPTHNLDSRAIEDLSETLRTRVDNFTDQLFLITHEKRLENAVTGNLYKLSRHRSSGDVTKVQRVN